MDEDKTLKEKIRLGRAEQERYQDHVTLQGRKMLVEVSNMCNHQCIFCANKDMTRKRGKIDTSFLEHILKEAYGEGIRQVGFYTTGEPLINQDLAEYIRKAKNIGFTYIYITTNGRLALLEKMKELSEADLDSVKFSINAIDREEYKLIHGADDFDIVINNIKDLIQWRNVNKVKLKIMVSYIATRYTQRPLKEIELFFKPLCDEIAVMPVTNAGGLNAAGMKYLSCEDGIYEFEAALHLPCHYLFDTVTVTYEGYLTACCIDFQNYLAYADLKETTLKDAWNNETIRKLRRQHIEKRLGNNLCHNCIYQQSNQVLPLAEAYASEIGDEMYRPDKIVERVELFKRSRGR